MGKEVLIVDDDIVGLRIIKKKLEIHQDVFSVVTAPNGLDAVKILKEKNISLVVTDLRMPGMDGFALLAHITDTYPDIPVIIITAYDMPKTKKVVLKGGAAGYIKKPFLMDDLAKQIVTTLEKQSDGGKLYNASLEMFIQLIEMEQKTCTIRITNKESEKIGVLFYVG